MIDEFSYLAHAEIRVSISFRLKSGETEAHSFFLFISCGITALISAVFLVLFISSAGIDTSILLLSDDYADHKQKYSFSEKLQIAIESINQYAHQTAYCKRSWSC